MIELVLIAGLIAGALFFARDWWRPKPVPVQPDRCEHCGKERVLLDEASEDAHLDEGQQHEERLGTADYHVWWCGACEQGLVVRHARSPGTRRVDCEKCGDEAAQEVVRTLSAATPEQGGEYQVRLLCGSCGHKQQFFRYTPRLRAP